MKLTFLGTRGEIEARTALHARHTSLLIEYRRRRVMIDAGLDWLDRIDEQRPHAIVVTHAHPDHAFGLRHGAPCPVWLPPAPRAALTDYPIEDARDIAHRAPVVVEGIGSKRTPSSTRSRRPPSATASPQARSWSGTHRTCCTSPIAPPPCAVRDCSSATAQP